MTMCFVYTQPTFALLATDTWAGEDLRYRKLEWSAGGWFVGTGYLDWILRIAPVLRALDSFADSPQVIRRTNERLRLVPDVRQEHVMWLMLGLGDSGPHARVLRWDGAEIVPRLEHGRGCCSGPPTLDVDRRQALLNECNRRLSTADLDGAQRAVANFLGSMVDACGDAGGVSDEIQIGLWVAESPGTWRPYFLQVTPWPYVASGEVRAEPLGPEGLLRPIVRREGHQRARAIRCDVSSAAQELRDAAPAMSVAEVTARVE